MMDLRRVVSVKQNSLAATGLPLELQQQIFSFLDTSSFHAARKVCRYWRSASQDAVTLDRQLRKLPIRSPLNARSASPDELLRLFDEAAYTLMLGTKIRRNSESQCPVTRAYKHSFPTTSRACSTTDGSRTVTLNDRAICLFDTSEIPAKLLAQRPLNDLKETVGNGPWLKVASSSYKEIALSSDGSLLAIAQERTIQIYDLTAEPDSFTVNEYISSASGHYICGVAFEQNDCVLRVHLSGKGTVLYLGTPYPDYKGCEKANVNHWKSKAGLRHTFLDTSTLVLERPSQDLPPPRLSGLQLLKPFGRNGYLFASQRHGGGQSSHYVLGHVRATLPDVASSLTVDPESVIILAKLESFLSSWNYIVNANTTESSGLGMWESMPSAHEHHPSFAMSEGCNLLALAEQAKKQVRPIPATQLFLYRLPSVRKMQELVESRGIPWTGQSSMPRISLKHDDFEFSSKPAGESALPRVGRIPRCLATVQGTLTEVKFEDHWDGEEKSTVLKVGTSDNTRRWSMMEV